MKSFGFNFYPNCAGIKIKCLGSRVWGALIGLAARTALSRLMLSVCLLTLQSPRRQQEKLKLGMVELSGFLLRVL